jgi:hypothetical protein
MILRRFGPGLVRLTAGSGSYGLRSMLLEFLTGAQVAGYGRFDGVPSRALIWSGSSFSIRSTGS